MLYQKDITERPFWVISDTHFFHNNIVKYAGRPENHQELMIANWQRLVQPNDLVLHLGDIAFGKADDFPSIADQLPGRKYIIKGNHDKRKRKWYRRCGFTVLEGLVASYENDWTIHFSHYPMPRLVRTPKHLNVHGHIHENLMKDRRMINVSVEQIDYSPVWIETLLSDRIAELERANAVTIES